MIFKQIPLLLLTLCFVLSACAVAEESPAPAKQKDQKVTSDKSTKVDTPVSSKAESKDAQKTVTELKPIPEEETMVEESTPVMTSTVPARVYSNRAYGYSRQQIRSMPMVARPDRPGHFFGNTVRAMYRARRGR